MAIARLPCDRRSASATARSSAIVAPPTCRPHDVVGHGRRVTQVARTALDRALDNPVETVARRPVTAKQVFDPVADLAQLTMSGVPSGMWSSTQAFPSGSTVVWSDDRPKSSRISARVWVVPAYRIPLPGHNPRHRANRRGRNEIGICS